MVISDYLLPYLSRSFPEKLVSLIWERLLHKMFIRNIWLPLFKKIFLEISCFFNREESSSEYLGRALERGDVKPGVVSKFRLPFLFLGLTENQGELFHHMGIFYKVYGLICDHRGTIDL